jgi:hypothetical protein
MGSADGFRRSLGVAVRRGGLRPPQPMNRPWKSPPPGGCFAPFSISQARANENQPAQTITRAAQAKTEPRRPSPEPHRRKPDRADRHPSRAQRSRRNLWSQRDLSSKPGTRCRVVGMRIGSRPERTAHAMGGQRHLSRMRRPFRTRGFQQIPARHCMPGLDDPSRRDEERERWIKVKADAAG